MYAGFTAIAVSSETARWEQHGNLGLPVMSVERVL